MSQRTAEQLRQMAARLETGEPPLLAEHPLADIQSIILVAAANLFPDATPGTIDQFIVDNLSEQIDRSQIHSALKRMQTINAYVEQLDEPLFEPGKKPATRFSVTKAGRSALAGKIRHLRRLADELEALTAKAIQSSSPLCILAALSYLSPTATAERIRERLITIAGAPIAITEITATLVTIVKDGLAERLSEPKGKAQIKAYKITPQGKALIKTKLVGTDSLNSLIAALAA